MSAAAARSARAEPRDEVLHRDHRAVHREVDRRDRDAVVAADGRGDRAQAVGELLVVDREARRSRTRSSSSRSAARDGERVRPAAGEVDPRRARRLLVRRQEREQDLARATCSTPAAASRRGGSGRSRAGRRASCGSARRRRCRAPSSIAMFTVWPVSSLSCWRCGAATSRSSIELIAEKPRSSTRGPRRYFCVAASCWR